MNRIYLAMVPNYWAVDPFMHDAVDKVMKSSRRSGDVELKILDVPEGTQVDGLGRISWPLTDPETNEQVEGPKLVYEGEGGMIVNECDSCGDQSIVLFECDDKYCPKVCIQCKLDIEEGR